MPRAIDVFIIAPKDPGLTVRLTMEEYAQVQATLNSSLIWAKQIETKDRILLVPAGGIAFETSKN